MTPAIAVAEKVNIWFAVHEYEHDPQARSFGLEAAEKLGFDPARVFKTLLVSLDQKQLGVGIVPVDAMLNMKLLAKALGHKRASLAERSAAERATGYVMGGISPLGQKKRLPMGIDESALGFDTVYVSGGRRGLDLELKPDDLVSLTTAVVASLV